MITTCLSAQPILVGIAGGSGSGKTTLTQRLKEAFGAQATFIPQDNYYKDLSHLPLQERGKTNFDHPDSIEFSLLREQLQALKAGDSVTGPLYSFFDQTRKVGPTIVPTDLILVEGILIFAIPEIRELFDLKIFVDVDSDVRVLRRVKRDMAERGFAYSVAHEQYLTTVKPMHDLFVESSKQYADIIIPEGGQNETAFALVRSYLEQRLKD